MMKKLITLTLVFLAYTLSGSQKREILITSCYNSNYVEISTIQFKKEYYNAITMKRDSNRVRAKYFAAPDNAGNNVFKRLVNWSKGKNIILVSSGTYMDQAGKPEGLTIDNGIPVNETLISGKMDALVIVYATGGIVVSNLKDGDLTLQGIKPDPKRKFNLRNSAWDKDDFMTWAKVEEATVFQTHLLVYKNELMIKQPNSNIQANSTKEQERRFLAVGKNDEGKLIHVIIHCPAPSTLFEGTKKALEFLKDYKEMEVTFMINLDTGNHDEFELHNSDCSFNQKIKGTKPLSGAVNLLSYYFQ